MELYVGHILLFGVFPRQIELQVCSVDMNLILPESVAQGHRQHVLRDDLVAVFEAGVGNHDLAGVAQVGNNHLDDVVVEGDEHEGVPSLPQQLVAKGARDIGITHWLGGPPDVTRVVVRTQSRERCIDSSVHSIEKYSVGFAHIHDCSGTDKNENYCEGERFLGGCIRVFLCFDPFL